MEVDATKQKVRKIPENFVHQISTPASLYLEKSLSPRNFTLIVYLSEPLKSQNQ